jgi:DNA-binding transcriptional MerR regulator
MSESLIPEALRDFVEFKDNGYLSDRFRRIVLNFNIQDQSVDLERFQCREDGRELDEVHISQLLETVEKNVVEEDISSGVFGTEDQLPLVGEIGGKFYVISGAHRVAALIRSEFTHEIPVRFYQAPGTINPVQLEAVFRLISHHENEHKSMPKKLTRADRLRSLKLMLKNPIYQGLPASQLAKITGVSDKTITSLREKLGIKPEQVTTRDGKTRSSGRKSEGRSDRLAELEAENLRLRKIIERLKEESHRFKAEVHTWLEGIIDSEKETEPEQAPTVRPSTQPQLEAPALALPSPVDEPIDVDSSPAPSQTFEKVSKLIEDWNERGGSKSLNQLTGRNWSRYKQEMTPEQVEILETMARERGLKVESRGRSAKV